MKTKKIIAFSLLLFGLTSFAFAEKVEIKDAEKAAVNFYYERINQYHKTEYKAIAIKDIFVIKEKSLLVYYVFNMKDNGYVIVSADNKIYPVLGYSFKGSYSIENQPDNFKSWMLNYKKQIFYAVKNKLKTNIKTRQEWEHLLTNDKSKLKILKDEKQVEPLLISTWDQGKYYNEMCPLDPAGPGGHVWAGCVATAMAQVMFYYRFPLQGTGSYSYYDPPYGNLSADFGNTHYQWNSMTNSVNSSNLAVAQLLYHIGVSVDMDYGPNGSGMWNHKAAYSFKTYFNYSSETQYVFRDSTNINWDSLLISHLDRKMPMYYAGWSGIGSNNGHAFVCDGCQGTDYFHFNWGWSGSFDGYFYLDELNPGGSNFNYAQEVIINCYPDTLNYNYPYFCNGDTILTSKKGSIEDGSGPNKNYLNNTYCIWLISPQTTQDSITNITLSFDKFNTENSNDIFTVYDGATISASILGRFSGTEMIRPVTSTGNKMLIVFTTNDSITSPGWYAEYNTISPVWCHGMTGLTAYCDTLSDGSGTFNYNNNSMCMWEIIPPDASSLILTFISFDTEPDNDFVKIYDHQTQQLLAEYSGTDIPEPVTSDNGSIYIIFKTNQTITAQGWEAYYTTSCLGIKNNNNIFANFNIYPNPINNILKLSFNVLENQSFKLKIISIKGETMYFENVYYFKGNYNKSIDVHNYSKGIYILSLTSDKETFNKKVVIE